MVASVAKPPTYAERAKKAQSIKAPASIRPSTSVSSPIQPTAPQSSTAPKSHPKSPVVDVLVAAGPSSSLASQDTGLANVNAVNDHVSTTASSTSASSPSIGHPTPHNILVSSTPGTTKVPVDNVWNRRKEQMVSRATTTSTPSSSIQQIAATPLSSDAVEDPFVVRIPPRPGPPAAHDSESWPEVGKSTPSADSKEGSATGKDQEPAIRKGEKQKWVPIPAAELQAAADAQNQNQKSSSSKQHSRAQSRAQSQKGTNASRSNNSITTSTAHSGSQNTSRAASQAHSRIQSTTHSRIASRSTSAQSSPRLSRGGRKLEDDSSSLITNNVDNNISNLNGSPYVPPRNVNTPPTQVPLQPVTYVDTPSSDPPSSYPVPLYGPIPISGSPYYALPQQSHDHGSLPPAHPLPIQQASSQQGSAQGSYNASPLSAPYVLPSGGPNGYPPSNVVSTHGHSPISMPPSQPLSPYPPGPGGYLHIYPPHMYGGMPEYMHSQAASYSQWNGNGFPSHPSAAQSPYAPNPHLLAYPQPLSHQPSIAIPSHQRKSISPSEEQQQSQLPPPTMIHHPPPPEESRPVAGYREIGTFNGGPDLDGTGHSDGSSIKLGSVVFGSIGMEAAGTPHLESNESIDPEIAGEQTDTESLPKAFTTFSIGVTPDEPKPPRIRSRTSSAKPSAKIAPINGDLKSSPTVVADSASPTSAETQEVNDAQNRNHPVDLNGTEKKWQFGSTDLNAPLDQPETITSNINGPQSIHPSSVAAEMADVPLGVMGISHSEQLPPLPLDLQPAPRMVGNDRLVQGLAHPQPLGDDFAIKDFRYGFGLESGPGYGMGVVQGEQLPQGGRRDSDMTRDQDIREDGRRWRDEFEYDRSGRSGPGRDRDRDGDGGGMMGRPRRGSYGGYGYDRGGYGGRRGRAGGPGGYGRSMHRPRGSFHAPPQPRQPPFTVTPPQQQFQPLMQYNDPSTPNGYYLPAQSPTSHHQGMAYLPIHTHAQVGYEAYTPIPQHLPQHGVTATGPTVPVPLYVNYQLDTRYRLLSQLEYYLSPQNMAQDYYLRQNMDCEGWISIHLIASFKRVKALTDDPQLVKEVLSSSSVVQVNHDWVRMNDWERFVLPDAHPSVVETEQPNEADHQDEEEEEEEEDVVFIL